MPSVVVVLPSTTYRATEFLNAAGDIGVELVIVSEQPPPLDMGDHYLQIDCSDPYVAADAIVELGDRVPIDAVVAADDGGVVMAAIAGTRLGLRSNPVEAATSTRNKADQRRMLAAGEVPQPRFAVLEAGDAGEAAGASIGYPLVVKPVDRAAGQGVIRVDEPADLADAVTRVRGIVGSDAQLVIEAFMPGDEVAVEGLVVEGDLNVLAVFDKPDATEGPTFPETILVTPSLLPTETLVEAERVARAAVAAIGLTHGPVHIELKVGGREIRVIELAARSIGGLCSRSLNFGLMGTTLETLILRNSLGRDKPELRREAKASGVLMIPIPGRGRLVEVANLQRVRDIPHVTGIDLTTRPGQNVLPPPEGDRYLGFVFARAATPHQVTDSLRTAQKLLEVVVE